MSYCISDAHDIDDMDYDFCYESLSDEDIEKLADDKEHQIFLDDHSPQALG